ncbi:hypothetical protein ABEF93_005666 [Exophiala dermatitidis]
MANHAIVLRVPPLPMLSEFSDELSTNPNSHMPSITPTLVAIALIPLDDFSLWMNQPISIQPCRPMCQTTTSPIIHCIPSAVCQPQFASASPNLYQPLQRLLLPILPTESKCHPVFPHMRHNEYVLLDRSDGCG